MKIEMEREFQRMEGRMVSEREGKRVRDRERKTETEIDMEMEMEKEKKMGSEGAKERNAETAEEHGIVKEEDDDDLLKDLL